MEFFQEWDKYTSEYKTMDDKQTLNIKYVYQFETIKYLKKNSMEKHSSSLNSHPKSFLTILMFNSHSLSPNKSIRSIQRYKQDTPIPSIHPKIPHQPTPIGRKCANECVCLKGHVQIGQGGDQIKA